VSVELGGWARDSASKEGSKDHGRGQTFVFAQARGDESRTKRPGVLVRVVTVAPMRGGPLGDFDRMCEEEYASIVTAAYLVTGDREEAYDIAQEAFERAYARWRRVSQLDRPGAWVQRVAMNLAISWRRRQKVRHKPRFPAPEHTEPLSESLDAELMQSLLGLTPAQRAAVVLRFCLDLSVDEVANRLSKRPGTVRALTAQGVARLRRSLASREDTDELTR
jgi:RNA polymerase sigma-70 factor, ECF subfamily